MIQDVLETNEDLRQFLFVRGFLATSNPDIPSTGFPFYGAWQHTEVAGLHFWTHPQG